MRYDEALFSKLSSDLIPPDSQVIFVSDAFPEQLLGGAELTLQALIDTAPCKAHKILASQITIDHLKQGAEKYWIFGNYSTLNPQLTSVIAANLRYSIVECDYKFCAYRSIEKHAAIAGTPCDCEKSQIGALTSQFMAAADHVWWMSEAQKDIYLAKFPFLVDYEQSVLSSVFNDAFFETIEKLRSEAVKSNTWLVLDSQSWIKGTSEAIKLAEDRGLTFEIAGRLAYPDMLRKLAEAKGVIFLPKGGDTCPRFIIEAKLLGCELILNDHVQHAQEDWFVTNDLLAIEAYLRAAPAAFWRDVAKHVNRDYTLSGYATTYDCLKQEYPFEASVRSLLGFCDEVVVVDAGSTDGTLDVLRELQSQHLILDREETIRDALVASAGANTPEMIKASLNASSRLKVHIVERNWSDTRSALFDGMQKAEARARCSSDFVWQMDVDEVVVSSDWPKVRELVKDFPKVVPLISLPVIEAWGSWNKIRLDINPQKWRLSRNSPRITHGVPAQLRAKDDQGRDVAMPGTDGCDMIDAQTGDPIVFLGFLTKEMEQARQQAAMGDERALFAYESWFEKIAQNVPSVYHSSWLNIERKIKLYQKFWSRHWQVLSGDDSGDTPENNMFFDKKWSDVTNEDIKTKAKELAENTGGHIFHNKYRGQKISWMTLKNVNALEETKITFRTFEAS